MQFSKTKVSDGNNTGCHRLHPKNNVILTCYVMEILRNNRVT